MSDSIKEFSDSNEKYPIGTLILARHQTIKGHSKNNINIHQNEFIVVGSTKTIVWAKKIFDPALYNKPMGNIINLCNKDVEIQTVFAIPVKNIIRKNGSIEKSNIPKSVLCKTGKMIVIGILPGSTKGMTQKGPTADSEQKDTPIMYQIPNTINLKDSAHLPVHPSVYYLTNRDCINQSLCPNCGNQLSVKRYNIPVYDINGSFISYYVQTLMYCSNCDHALMTDSAYKEIQKRMSKQRYHINPSNVRVTYHPRDNSYFYEPISGFELFFEKKANETTHANQITTLAKLSFLANEGYSIHLPETERHHILRDAVEMYGRRRVVDHLKFLVSTREAQRDGRTKYANAIRIWQDDLNYIIKI